MSGDVWNRGRLPVFIHIPKTGGSSINAALKVGGKWRWGWSSGHAPAALVESRMEPGQFRRTFVWTVVRNPWDRAVSWFFYNWKDKPNELPQTRLGLQDSFHRFIQSSAHTTLGLMNRSAYTMLHNSDGGRLVPMENVVRYEELAIKWPYICKAIEMPHEPLPILNTSTLRRGRTYHEMFLRSEDIERVAAMCWWEIKHVHYSFE